MGALLLGILLAQADLYEQGTALLRAGRVAEAEKAFRAHLAAKPGHVEARANLGAVLARKEDYAGAIEQYGRALRLAPQLKVLHLNLGLAYFKARQWEEAIREFSRYLAAAPGQRQAMQLRALALMEVERYGEAARAFEGLMPGDVTVQLGLATAYLRSERVAEAQKILGPLLERGDSAEVLLTVGQALMAEDRGEEALAAFLKARGIDAKLPTLGLHIGSVYWKKKEFARAIAEWREELKQHPENAEAKFTLGAGLAQSGGDKIEAERLLRATLRQKPRHAKANYQLAKLVWQSRKSGEAAVCLERAVAADRDYREAYYLMGTVYTGLGKKVEAARAFAEAKRLSAKELSTQQDLFSEQR
ncbi:MAG: tetratricopeptide repeat protein [Acidobacteriota bacterium]